MVPCHAVTSSETEQHKSKPGPLPRPPSLKANFSWTLWANGISALCQCGMLVTLAKFGKPEMVGQYAVALSIVVPVGLFSDLQLRTVQATDVRSKFLFCDYLGIRLFTICCTCVVVLGITLVGRFQPETTLAILGVALYKAIESVYDIFYGLLQRHERMDRISQSMLLRSILSLVAFAFGVYVTNHVYWGTICLALVSAMVTLFHDIPVTARVVTGLPKEFRETWSLFKPQWRPRQIKQLVWSSIPLGCMMMLSSLHTNIPRYFIQHRFGEIEVGIFSALAYVMAAGNIVIEALAQSAIPRLARLYQYRNRQSFRLLLLKLAGVGCALGASAFIVACLAGRTILTLLYRPEYARHVDVFLILMASAIPTYITSFIGYGLTAARLFWIQLPLSLLSSGSVLLACLWLVPQHGLKGAAEAFFIMSVVRLAAFGIIMIRATRRFQDESPVNILAYTPTE